MPKVGMGPVRRRQLVEATIATIHEFGLAESTVTRIARKADVSPGIVHHYFADKDELLFETMRVMLARLRQAVVVQLKQADTPLDRLHAIIDASFAGEQFSGDVVTAWLALYASARQSAALMRILHLYHRRLHSNLVSALKAHLPHAPQHDLADAIASLIDGLYLRAALNPAMCDASQAQHSARRFTDMLLAGWERVND